MIKFATRNVPIVIMCCLHISRNWTSQLKSLHNKFHEAQCDFKYNCIIKKNEMPPTTNYEINVFYTVLAKRVFVFVLFYCLPGITVGHVCTSTLFLGQFLVVFWRFCFLYMAPLLLQNPNLLWTAWATRPSQHPCMNAVHPTPLILHIFWHGVCFKCNLRLNWSDETQRNIRIRSP
jgi:hypothetical protein